MLSPIEHYDTVSVPDYALPYLVNSDASGLDNSDLAAIDRWLDSLPDNGANAIFQVGENEGFTVRPVFGLACETYSVEIWIPCKNTTAS